jgi:hypothetical protein
VFQKGKSGNPGGRPKAADDVKALARQYSTESVKRLVEWMRSDNPQASTRAAETLLDRAWGKAEQHSTADITHNYIARMPTPSKDGADWIEQHAEPLKLLQ